MPTQPEQTITKRELKWRLYGIAANLLNLVKDGEEQMEEIHPYLAENCTDALCSLTKAVLMFNEEPLDEHK